MPDSPIFDALWRETYAPPSDPKRTYRAVLACFVFLCLLGFLLLMSTS